MAAAQPAPPLRVLVRDAAGAEPLRGVKLELVCGEARTDASTGDRGTAEIAKPAAGPCRLTTTLVGYRPVRVEVSESSSDADVVLTPDSLTRRDSVEVHEGPFEAESAGSPAVRTLSGIELKNLAGVLADDPFRAVQSLPGVSSSNDYVAQFVVRGAGFNRVGLVVDGVLLEQPFFAVRTQDETGSLSLIDADLVEELTLNAGAPPVSYMDRTAGALDARMREGSRRTVSVRVNAGVAAAGVIAEGPIGRSQKGSWLASVRKSYLQYILQRSAAADDSLAFGFFDVNGRLTYDLTPKNNVTLSILDGTSDLDRSRSTETLGPNSIQNATFHLTFLNAGWRYTPSSRATLQQHLAWVRETYENVNSQQLPLGRASYYEWAWNGSATYQWTPTAPLQAGWSVRHIRDEGYDARYQFNPTALRRRDEWRGTGVRAGGFVNQSGAWRGGRVQASAGLRWDGFTSSGPVAVSPYAGILGRITPRNLVQFAWSEAVQYPRLSQLYLERMGNPNLLPERAIHYTGAYEHRFDDRTRMRVELFQRNDRDLIVQPLLDPRLLSNGAIFVPPPYPPFENSLRGRARGAEIFFQRRTANRLNGWVSYGYVETRMHDGVTGAVYPSDAEQRHTVNVFASWRINAKWQLVGRYFYGSNYPVPGFLQQRGDLFYLSTVRNAVWLPQYHRGDIRLNRSFQRKTWRGMIYVEVMNVANRRNVAYDGFNGFSARTGQAFPSFLKLFPIVPAAGVMLEWDAALWK